MKVLDDHFDELLLFAVVVLFAGLWLKKPEAKDFLEGLVTGLAVSLRGRISNAIAPPKDEAK